MKIRTGFVSNSSSSSFIIVGEKPNYMSIKLNEKQIAKIINYIGNKEFDPVEVERTNEDVYLTPFICDGLDDYYDIKHMPNSYEYCCGGYGLPYGEENYDIISDEIDDFWIYKGHNNVIGLGIIPKKYIKYFPKKNVFKYYFPSNIYTKSVPYPLNECLGADAAKIKLVCCPNIISIKVNHGDYVVWTYGEDEVAEKIKKFGGKVI